MKDADVFVSHIMSEHAIRMEDVIVVGHSVGGVIAAAWVHDFAPPIRGLVLATPAFRVKLYVPAAIPLLRTREALLGSGFVKSYVKAHLLTHDAAEAERYRSDALIFRQIAVNMLLDLHDTSRRLRGRRGRHPHAHADAGSRPRLGRDGSTRSGSSSKGSPRR